MAVERKPKWNPQYSKHSVRTVLQDIFSRNEPYGITPSSRKLIKEILTLCDEKVLEKEEEAKNA